MRNEDLPESSSYNFHRNIRRTITSRQGRNASVMHYDDNPTQRLPNFFLTINIASISLLKFPLKYLGV